MQIKIKIIPDDGPTEVHEVQDYTEAWMFFAKRLPVVPAGAENEVSTEITTSGTSFPIDPGFSIPSGELSPAPARQGFIKRLFGLR